MNKPRLARIMRVLVVACLTALSLLAVIAPDTWGVGSAHARPEFQDGTAYPAGTPTIFPTYDPYPAMTDTPSGPLPTADQTQPTQEQPTPFNTQIPQNTFTAQPNTFLTENAEMGEGQGTPPPSETPGITMTATITSTPAPPTPQPTPIIPERDTRGPGGINWGLFWIGFSLPVLAGCGWVLYLLDRRPDLFRPRG